MKKIVKSMIMLLCAAIMALPSSFGVQAAETIDTGRDARLTLEYAYDEQPIPGALFRLYRTADIRADGTFILSGDFANYPVNLKNLDAAGWNTAAHTLSVYVSADQLQPLHTGTTDQQGLVDFGSLEAGLYLLKADRAKAGNKEYSSEAFLVSLPSMGEDGVWNYEVQARPKSVMQETDPGSPPDKPSEGGETKEGEKEKLTVIKVWNDDGARSLRPSKIKVALLRDGETYKTVTLSSSNFWRHTWSGLSDEYSWEIVEQNVPDGYDVSYTDEKTVYTITNSVLEDIPEGEVPEGSMQTEIGDGPVPLAKLPQTGLLWWPVPFLAMIGLFLFGVGYKDYDSGKRKKDEK